LAADIILSILRIRDSIAYTQKKETREKKGYFMKRNQKILLIIYLLIILKPLSAQEDSAATLGKTHFIVGYTEDKKADQQSIGRKSCYPL